MTENGAFLASYATNVCQSDTSQLTRPQRAPVKVFTDDREAEDVLNDFPVCANHRDYHCDLDPVATPAISFPICDSPKLETAGKTRDTRFVRCKTCGFERHRGESDDRLPQWAWEPTRKLRKSSLIELATQSGGERLAWDRLTVPELVAEITRRQTAARKAHWAATNAKRAEDTAPARPIGLPLSGRAYKAIQSARVMITADEVNATLRAMPPLPFGGDHEQPNM